MKTCFRLIAISGALAVAAIPTVSSAGKRPVVPVGFHLAPVAAAAAEPVLTGKRASKKVPKKSNLLGSPLMSAFAAIAAGQAGQYLSTRQRYASLGAN